MNGEKPENMQKALEEIRDSFTTQTAHFDKRLNELSDGLRRLNNAVGGDVTMGQDGVITRLTKLEHTQNQHGDKFKVLHAMWWFAGSIGGVLVGIIVWILEKFHITPK